MEANALSSPLHTGKIYRRAVYFTDLCVAETFSRVACSPDTSSKQMMAQM